MKIIQIGPVTPELGGSSVGGIATHLCQLSESLLSLGYDVDILTTIKTDKKGENNLNIIGMNSKIKIFRTIITNPKIFLSALISGNYDDFVKKHYYDYIVNNYKLDDVVIHTHSLHNYFSDFINKKFNVIYTDHGFWQSENYDIESLLTRVENAKYIISVSGFAKGKLEEKIQDNEIKNKFKVIYNPIRINILDYYKKNEYRNNIFFNGYSESVKRKGLDLLYQNVISCFKNVQFDVICDDEGIKYLNGKTAKNINIYSSVSYDKVTELYQQAKLMILPSRSESFGLVYIEASINSVPVIGFKPIIDEFNNYLGCKIGYGYDPLIDSGEKLKCLTDLALKEVWDFDKIHNSIIEKLSWDRQIFKYENLYYDALK